MMIKEYKGFYFDGNICIWNEQRHYMQEKKNKQFSIIKTFLECLTLIMLQIKT